MGVTQSAQASRARENTHEFPVKYDLGGGNSVTSTPAGDLDADPPTVLVGNPKKAKPASPAAAAVEVVHKLHAPGCSVTKAAKQGKQRRAKVGAASSQLPHPPLGPAATKLDVVTSGETPTAESNVQPKVVCSCDADAHRSAT